MINKQLSGLTYRDVVRHYGLDVCDSHIGCADGLSRVAHYRTRYAGRVVHGSRLDFRASRLRLGEVLAVVAGIMLDHDHQSIPLWMKIYQANVWAMQEAKSTWKTQLSAHSDSQLRARRKVLHLARITHVRLRYHHPTVYQWARIARGDNHHGSKATRTSRVDANAGQALRADRAVGDHDQ